jgi:hypothetical protein
MSMTGNTIDANIAEPTSWPRILATATPTGNARIVPHSWARRYVNPRRTRTRNLRSTLLRCHVRAAAARRRAGTVASMLRRTPVTAVLVAWTLLVWATRLRNIWADDALDLGGRLGRSALAGSFTVLAVLVAVGLWHRRSRSVGWLRPAVLALAAWTVAVWVVRMAGIATGGHGVGFVVVHLVLAVVSVGLAGLAAVEARAAGAASPVSSAPRPGRG